MEKILVVCIDQICHNVSLNQRGPNFNLWRLGDVRSFRRKFWS
jgi:hypothetical protein